MLDTMTTAVILILASLGILAVILLITVAYRDGRRAGREQGYALGHRDGWIKRHQQALQEEQNADRAAARARIRRR